MIDIVALVLLVRHVRRVAELKQQAAFAIITSTVALYVALEVAGVFLAFRLSGTFGYGFVGGLLGAGLAIALTLLRLRHMRDGRSEGQAPVSVGPQLAGAACAAWGKIVSIREGTRCHVCHVPCHQDCTDRHAATHQEAAIRGVGAG